jgi:glycosyltransferase involved in cell wall biosynthesis
MISALLIASLFIIQTWWSLVHYSASSLESPATKTTKLPSVTLAIPARNETYALAHCLEAALQNDYEKLEIIVLDDCSQDNTSQLIKSFAHAGVRFIQGDTPAEGWLGKNQACATLLKEGAGEYIIFIGIDTQLEILSQNLLLSRTSDS